MKFLKNVKFSNPCKYCLTRPVCRKKCDDLKNHMDTNEVTFCITILLMIIGIVVASIIVTWNIFILRISLLISVMLSYAFSIKYFLENEADKDILEKKLELSVVLLISPWGFTTAYLMDKFDLDKYVDKFSKRYADHLEK